MGSKEYQRSHTVGKRYENGGQLCMSLPGTGKEYLDDFEKYMGGGSESGPIRCCSIILNRSADCRINELLEEKRSIVGG